MTVGQRFDSLLANLTLTESQRSDGQTKHRGVRSCLNQYYYGISSGTANSRLVGSWGKDTQVRPPRDIDVLYELPSSVYYRIEKLAGNKQSQLLQEVKNVLLATYSTTKMKADGQVVCVSFGSYDVELVPAFLLDNGKYYICDTNGGGRYTTTDPVAETKAVSDSNDSTRGNTRDLIRVMKCWQGFCSVPIKSFWLELTAMDFLSGWPSKGNSSTWYDWMTRDYLKYLVGKANGYVVVPGTSEYICIGQDWKSKAESAYARAVKATEYEAAGKIRDAGLEWQKVFGNDTPLE